jgi:hypothetical protein
LLEAISKGRLSFGSHAQCSGRPRETKFCFITSSYEHNVTTQGRKSLSNSATAWHSTMAWNTKNSHYGVPDSKRSATDKRTVTAVGESLECLRNRKTCVRRNVITGCLFKYGHHVLN